MNLVLFVTHAIEVECFSFMLHAVSQLEYTEDLSFDLLFML